MLTKSNIRCRLFYFLDFIKSSGRTYKVGPFLYAVHITRHRY